MPSNKYDDIQLNVRDLLDAQAQRLPTLASRGDSSDDLTFSASLLSNLELYWMGFLFRSGLLRRLVYANLSLDWFNEFRQYWVAELGLRPIHLPDFFFLRGIYRQRFQELEVDEAQGGPAFLAAWQKPANIYLLFSYQYKRALNPLAGYRVARYLKRGARICEFGCGVAPVATSLDRFYRNKKWRIDCFDIPSYMLHFARWKFRDRPYIAVHELDPDNDEQLTASYDLINCLTVFEHLPRPLATAHHLYAHLKPGGYLVFNYITSQGDGLDTASALKDRPDVLQFIADHFEVIEGSLPLDGSSVGTVIAKKRATKLPAK
ncbi:hypothetical protein CL628_00615 [bacterium]|nr:hypothetical protein [bacterium]